MKADIKEEVEMKRRGEGKSQLSQLERGESHLIFKVKAYENEIFPHKYSKCGPPFRCCATMWWGPCWNLASELPSEAVDQLHLKAH